jgi:hypothetical protein
MKQFITHNPKRPGVLSNELPIETRVLSDAATHPRPFIGTPKGQRRRAGRRLGEIKRP